MHVYLFGRPVSPCRPRASGHCPVFLIGAYPSALHVRWKAPDWERPVRAVAVDNEPEPFWDGLDEDTRILAWKASIGFSAEAGDVTRCGRLNGSSGAWVRDRVLCPLKVERSNVWITDCLDTYFESDSAKSALQAPHVLRAIADYGIAPANHRPHPSEAAIVEESLRLHSKRLLTEIEEANADLLITLGNAALKVVRALTSASGPTRLDHNPSTYGARASVSVLGHSVEWISLAHPAAPSPYQRVHDRWLRAQN